MKTIQELARQSGLATFGGCTGANIERFAALVRKQALEEAAEACKDLRDGWMLEQDAYWSVGCLECEWAIRSMNGQGRVMAAAVQS